MDSSPYRKTDYSERYKRLDAARRKVEYIEKLSCWYDKAYYPVVSFNLCWLGYAFVDYPYLGNYWVCILALYLLTPLFLRFLGWKSHVKLGREIKKWKT